MSVIVVSPLSELDKVIAQTGARTMVSLAGPGKSITQPIAIDREWLALEFNDIPGPLAGYIAPSRKDVSQIIELGRRWSGEEPLLCQCWLGVSRSTASALMIAAARNFDQDFDELTSRLRSLSPTATPNPMMIRLADKQLNLNGRLTKAVQAIGRGVNCMQGEPFTLKV
ncbi:tyrosine phosphatase family protein [Ahrensia sp. R2A130]|uniref:tyrosine phosphatase family protein n=1 Tax=Ahrensia sp. R2A130 TaxID=744979 RepID=UPI0001E0A43E|nr:tyrosine phosphatase [Ahrensia sp. R2A130]EFL90646.1 putative tyrosine phosphatase protein [Ahrensia sp. R2A130]